MTDSPDGLLEVLQNLEKGSRVGVASAAGAELLSDRHLTRDDYPAVRRLLKEVSEQLEIELVVTGGMYGCTKLFIDAEAASDAEKRRLLEELFSDPNFADMARRAGFSALLIRDPYVYKTLTTGSMVGEPPPATVSAFVSYAHEDQEHCAALAKHLSNMVKQKLIRAWVDREVLAGGMWNAGIHSAMESAELFICLVSADFIASNYCWDIEVPYALSRQRSGVARTVPVIVRPVDWQETALSALQAVPSGARPVTLWPDRDEAWTDVVTHLRRLVRELRQREFRVP